MFPGFSGDVRERSLRDHGDLSSADGLQERPDSDDDSVVYTAAVHQGVPLAVPGEAFVWKKDE